MSTWQVMATKTEIHIFTKSDSLKYKKDLRKIIEKLKRKIERKRKII